MAVKSPFLVYQDFMSPFECDEVLKHIRLAVNYDANGFANKQDFANDLAQELIFEKFKHLIPEISGYYGIKYKGTELINFQQIPAGTNGLPESPRCYNATYMKKKWVRTKDVDLTCVLWFNDYNDKPPFDPREQVYGGRLEFPAYDFSLQPQKGTLIIYPAGPHFISGISNVNEGTLYQARFNIAADDIWLYDPKNYQGHYSEWFQEHV